MPVTLRMSVGSVCPVEEQLLRNFTERLLKRDAFLWVVSSDHEAPQWTTCQPLTGQDCQDKINA